MRLDGQGLRSSPAAAAAWAAWRREHVRGARARGSSSPSTTRRPARRPSPRSTAAGGEATFVRADVSNEADAKAMVDARRRRPTAGSTSSTTTPGSCPRPDHSVIDTDVDDLGPGHGRQRPRRVPGLQVRDPADARAGLRLDHQHRELRRDPRLLGAAGRVHGVEGRRAVADPLAGGPVRRPKGVRTNAICPGPDRDAAAHGLAAQGRGGQAAAAGAQPDRPLRQAGGDRQRRRSTSPPTSRAGRTAPAS